jgi:large subunit ribosomal protein L25
MRSLKMQKIILTAQVRPGQGKSKVKSLRRAGFIPAVLYSAGKPSHSLKLSRHDFLRFIHQHHLESTVINLSINPVKDNQSKQAGSKISHAVKSQKAWTAPVLVKDVQYDPVKEEVIHIDFQEISLTSKIKVNVGIVPKGEPVGAKQEGGTLNHLIWELEIECLPTEIPREIAVDVSQMQIGDAIHVRDLSVPAGIRVINNPEDLVLSLEAPIKEEEIAPAPAEGEEAAEPEVIKEKKELPEEGKEEEKKEKKEEKKEAKKEEKKEAGPAKEKGGDKGG